MMFNNEKLSCKKGTRMKVKAWGLPAGASSQFQTTCTDLTHTVPGRFVKPSKIPALKTLVPMKRIYPATFQTPATHQPYIHVAKGANHKTSLKATNQKPLSPNPKP